jgi:hypothetical protein
MLFYVTTSKKKNILNLKVPNLMHYKVLKAKLEGWNVFRCMRRIARNNCQLHHLCLPDWNNSANPIRRICMKFGIWRG